MALHRQEKRVISKLWTTFLSMLVRSGHPLLCLHFCVTRGASPVQRTFIIESKASIHEKSLYTIFMTQNVVLST